MVSVKLDLVLLLNIFYVYECSRRITGGEVVTTEKRYVVYLLKAPLSNKIYDSWVCGGALVSTLFIVTSAACVDDVEFLYAIAGYKNYVPDTEIENNECTKAKKKKVIYTCIPMRYDLKYDKIEKWSFIDIALVKVESPYDFSDESYKEVCSYIPAAIPINYETRFQNPGTDGLVFGWGHTEIWRKPGDTRNYNQEVLRYAPVKILDKQKCKTSYASIANMNDVIDQFMICSEERGEMDENGNVDMNGPNQAPKMDGCGGRQLSADVLTIDEILCEENRLSLRSNQSSSFSSNKNGTVFNQTRRAGAGICQNDHGGPLITWVGANEVLIGVASVFQVDDDSNCMGPFLYTSTQCNGAFLDCILAGSSSTGLNGGRSICDLPPIQRGYDTFERFISWINHPAGAAENEFDYGNSTEAETEKRPTPQYQSEAFKQFVKMKMKKKSQNNTISTRPQRPLYSRLNV
nr:uncharacterized protein LOC110377139 [Helicoverpa armigera]